MKQEKYKKLVISLIFGLIVTLSVFLEFIINRYSYINDKVLYIPRLVTDIIFECDLCHRALIFMLFFTFLFYSFLGFLIIYIIEKLRKKK